MARKELWAVLRAVIRQNRALTAGLFIAVAGAVAAALVPPLVLEQIVDGLTAGRGGSWALAAAYFAALALAGILDAGKEGLITLFGQKITRRLRQTMCAKLSRLPAERFVGQDPGATVSRFVGDVDTVEALFASGVISMAADICKVGSVLAVIFVKSRGLGILMLLVTPLLFWLTRAVQKRMLQAQLDNRRAAAQVSRHVPETIRNIRMIHTLQKERYMERRYDGAIQAGYRAMERSNFYDAVYSPVIVTISALVVAVMMVCAAMRGGMETLFGMSVGSAVAVIAYVGKVFEPLESIGMEIQNIQSAVAGVRRIGEFLAQPEQLSPDGRITLESLQKTGAPAIALREVSFGYQPGQTVLRRCSFTVETGGSATLTGRTGAGKSTVFKLLLGLYAPLSGSVLVFGVPADRIPPQIRRRLFGYVEQSFRMVPGTVADQITLWDETISRAAVWQAAGLVGLHETILELERGYDTPCAPELFSQGQWQLLSIARAVAADPAILLLDEITANLDGQTERLVLEALRRAARNRTVLSISHRLFQKTTGRRIPLEMTEDTGDGNEG